MFFQLTSERVLSLLIIFVLTKFQELTNEQILFTNILISMANSPNSASIVHSQCQTTQEPAEPHTLPTAKFDLMVNHVVDPSEFSVIVQVNGDSHEEAELIVSNKTDTSINLHKLSEFVYCHTQSTVTFSFFIQMSQLLWRH